MMLAANAFRTMVVRDTLKQLGDWSMAAEDLLVGTAIQESGLGQNLKSGRFLGIYHISPQTHQTVWDKYLIDQPDLASHIRGLAGQRSFLNNPHQELTANLNYATAIAWMVYKRHNLLLPEDSDIVALAKIWHRYFHAKASASVADFVDSYQLLAGFEYEDEYGDAIAA